MSTKYWRLIFISCAIVCTSIVVITLVCIRKPTAPGPQTYSQPDQVQLSLHHEFLDLLLNRTRALHSNMSVDNMEKFRSIYQYFLAKRNFHKLWPCVHAKVKEIHAILDNIFHNHMQDCNQLLLECRNLPQPLIMNCTSQDWNRFDKKTSRLQRRDVKIMALSALTSSNDRIKAQHTIKHVLDEYKEQALSGSPILATERDLNHWVERLPLIISQDSVLEAAKAGARLSFIRRAEHGLSADDEAKALLQRLRTFTPLNHTDCSTRLNHFTTVHSGLSNSTCVAISPALKHQIDDQMDVAELKFLASEAIWAITMAISNGRRRSFGDLPLSSPEYQTFIDKWNEYPRRQKFQDLKHSVETQHAKLGQLKIMLCTEEIFRFYEVRKSYDGSCWRLCNCLLLQHNWNVTYGEFSNEIKDEFEIARRLNDGMEFSERELFDTVSRLEEIESNQASQDYCPGPSIADLRQIIKLSFLLPNYLNSLLKRIMTLRMTLGWGAFDLKGSL